MIYRNSNFINFRFMMFYRKHKPKQITEIPHNTVCALCWFRNPPFHISHGVRLCSHWQEHFFFVRVLVWTVSGWRPTCFSEKPFITNLCVRRIGVQLICQSKQFCLDKISLLNWPEKQKNKKLVTIGWTENEPRNL